MQHLSAREPVFFGESTTETCRPFSIDRRLRDRWQIKLLLSRDNFIMHPAHVIRKLLSARKCFSCIEEDLWCVSYVENNCQPRQLSSCKGEDFKCISLDRIARIVAQKEYLCRERFIRHYFIVSESTSILLFGIIFICCLNYQKVLPNPPLMRMFLSNQSKCTWDRFFGS